MASNKLTYSKSGVNIPKADSFVKFISSLARKSSKSGDFKNIGGFGAISPIPSQLKDPHIVTSTDGVGTKICLLYTSPSPRDGLLSRMPSSA